MTDEYDIRSTSCNCNNIESELKKRSNFFFVPVKIESSLFQKIFELETRVLKFLLLSVEVGSSVGVPELILILSQTGCSNCNQSNLS